MKVEFQHLPYATRADTTPARPLARTTEKRCRPAYGDVLTSSKDDSLVIVISS